MPSSERKLDEPEVMKLCLNALRDLDFEAQCRTLRWLQMSVDQEQVARSSRARGSKNADDHNGGGPDRHDN